MVQLIPFDPSKGGRLPLFCLANVCKGYSIGNKYESAWIAWQHTEQQFTIPPTGLDVPLFYSYTTTIDGVTENYGHINVRLANGTVWSDGSIYPSIEAYEANHFPRYVGWGESVNDYKILEGEPMATSAQIDDTISKIIYDGYGRPATQGEFDNLRPLYMNNYVEANITVLSNIDKDPLALKNKAPAGYRPVGQLYIQE